MKDNHEERLKEIVELYNSGIILQKDLQKETQWSTSTICKYIKEAKERGMIGKKKNKFEELVELYNNGTTDLNELSKKLEIEISTVKTYMSTAKKQGILKKVHKKDRIDEIAELYNSGVYDVREIAEKFGIEKRSAVSYISSARRRGLIQQENNKKIKSDKFMILVELYNSGIKEVEVIASKTGLSESTVSNYLRMAKRQGLITFPKNKLQRFAELYNLGIDMKKIQSILEIKNYSIYTYMFRAKEKGLILDEKESKEEKDLKLRVIEGLKSKYPREVAISLGISFKEIYDIIDKLSLNDKKNIKKEQIKSNPLYDKVKYLINEKNMDTQLALHYLYNTMTDPIEQINLAKLYYVGENLDMSDVILKNIINDEGINIDTRKKAYEERGKIFEENVSKKIRNHYKISKEMDSKPISYDELCRKYYVRTKFIVDILGEENRDYGE